MAGDISGFQTKIVLTATSTFPFGLVLTQFADDTDPLDIPSLQVGDVAMGVNGDLLRWSKPNPIKVTLAVTPNGTDDINLSILLNANRVGKGKNGARDIITFVASYPDGRLITMTNGLITDGTPGLSIASSARFKTKTYAFAFENIVGI